VLANATCDPPRAAQHVILRTAKQTQPLRDWSV
jgi:hypothetical protein